MTERSLVYKITVRGQAEGVSAIRSIADAAARASREEAKAEQETARSKSASRRRSTDDAKKSIDEESKHATMLSRLNQKLEAQRAKDAEKGAKDREKAAVKSGDNIVKALNKELREHEKVEKSKTKLTEREAAARVKVETKSADDIRRFVERSEAATAQHAMQQRRQAASQAQRDARQFARDRAFEERRLYKGLATGVSEGLGGALNYSAGLVSRGARGIASGMGLERGYDVSDIVGEKMRVDQLMQSISIEARNAGTSFGGAGSFDKRAGTAKLASVAKDTGYTQEELGGALDAYSEKGSGATGLRDLDKIAMQSRAMGADPASVARLRANLGMHGMSSDAQDSFIARMHFVGKTGVFRASDMAAQSEQMLAAFGPDIEKGGNNFLAFANEARKSTGGGAQARTAFDSALDTVDKKRSKIEALGVKYADANGESRDKVEIIKDIIAAEGGDRTRLSKIFDPSRSGKAITTLVDAYNGKNPAVPGMKGHAAMDALLAGDESLKNANMGEMQKDANEAMSSQSVQVAKAMESLRQKIGEKLLPIIDRLVEKLPKFLESLDAVTGWITSHPLASAGAAVGGSLAFGFAKQGLQVAANSGARYLAGKLVNTVPGAGGVLGGAIGNAIAGAGGGSPVYVTNWPGGGIGGGLSLPGGGGALGGGALSEGALAAAGSASGAAVMGTAIAAAVSLAIIAAIGDGVVNNHDTSGKPKVSREATEEDKAELAAGRAAEKEKKETIENTIAYGTNPTGDNKDVWKAGRDLDAARGKKWAYEALAKDAVVETREMYGPGQGAKGNTAMWAQTGGDGSGVVGNFHKELKEATKAMENFKNAAREAKGGFSVFKGPGV